jgi:hypothetical protein
MTLKTPFEKETCGRCGGCGRYSFNQMHGSTCYGCGGKGERLTKRGAAARAVYLESCKVLARDLVVGDMIDFGGVTLGGTPYSRKHRIETIAPHVQRYKSGAACNDPDAPWQEAHVLHLGAMIKGVQNFITQSPDAPVRKYWPAEINDQKIAAALAYQATLSKTGKPLKRGTK